MQRKSIKIQNYTISFLHEGSGQPLVFLHAFPFNALMWEHQLEELGKKHQVIALDFPSFGASHPTPPALSMDLAASLTHDLLQNLQHEQVTVIGLSMGGYIALAFAELYPEMISTLVLADTHGREDAPEKKRQREQMITTLKTKGTAPLIQQFPHSTLGKTTLDHRPDVLKKVHSLMNMASAEAIVSALRGMAMRPNRLGMLKQFSKPVYVIEGDEDILTPLSDAEDIVEAAANSTLHVIPKAGHLSNIEQPTHFNSIINSIISKS